MTNLALASAPPGVSDLESVDLVFRLLELLASAPRPLGVTEVARALDISKPRAHRHLRALALNGYARQDSRSEGYEIGVGLLRLGESVRDRFNVMGAIRPVMASLRAATGLAVTASALVGDEVVVLDMLQGARMIEFSVRPGSKMDLHASAHGLVVMAFGPPLLLDATLSRPLKPWTDATLTDPDAVRAEVEAVRQRGWATASDAVQVGVNALAAPVLDHRGVCRGAVAIVGATQHIAAEPTPEQITLITEAAAEASRSLGWREN